MERLEEICKSKVHGIILREKDLTPEAYENLALQVLKLCNAYGVTCILHSFTEVAEKLSHKAIHVTMEKLRSMTEEERSYYTCLGASCHSIDEAVEGEKLGCSYVTYSHVFPTKCKEGLEPKGVDLLEQVCRTVKIPVYALGGINEKNAADTIKAGARGICSMAQYMTEKDVERWTTSLRASLEKGD